MMGTAAGTGVEAEDEARAGAEEDEEDPLEELAPPPPLVSVPTDVTDAERAELSKDPNVRDEVVTVESPFLPIRQSEPEASEISGHVFLTTASTPFQIT